MTDGGTSTLPGWRTDAAVLTAVAVLIRLPVFLASRHVGYDDGVFGLSALLLRDGATPYRELWSPQGPLHLPLLFVADLVGLRTGQSPRVLPLASGIAATLLVYAIGRRIGTRRGALLAAALVTATGSLLWTTGPITSDGPA